MTINIPDNAGVEALFEHEHAQTNIPFDTRSCFETALQSDLSEIRFSVEPALQEHGALACVRENRVLVSPSAPGPATPAGIALLGHELGHVLQQRAGRAGTTRSGSTLAADLEAEADQIGLHCAARFFPGVLRDPGMPAAMSRGVASHARSGRQPIQFVISSRESFEAFVSSAWTYLNEDATHDLSVSTNMATLYNLAATYNPNRVAPKTALVDDVLYDNMQKFILATKPCAIKLQKSGRWPVLTDEVDNLAVYYRDKADGKKPIRNDNAQRITRGYLHVYPTKPAPATWRIALNVEPQSMAAAMKSLTLLNDSDKYPCIGHMKFYGPAGVTKADSVIAYVNRDLEGGKYEEFKNAVIEASRGLELQNRSGAMWEEIGKGIAEASEPPKELRSSFTSYRSIVTYLAYWVWDGWPTFETFLEGLPAVMWIFGLSVENPFEQGPLQTSFDNYANWALAFKNVQKAWKEGT